MAAKSCGVKPLVVVLLPRSRYKWQRPTKKRDGGLLNQELLSSKAAEGNMPAGACSSVREERT